MEHLQFRAFSHAAYEEFLCRQVFASTIRVLNDRVSQQRCNLVILPVIDLIYPFTKSIMLDANSKDISPCSIIVIDNHTDYSILKKHIDDQKNETLHLVITDATRLNKSELTFITEKALLKPASNLQITLCLIQHDFITYAKKHTALLNHFNLIEPLSAVQDTCIEYINEQLQRYSNPLPRITLKHKQKAIKKYRCNLLLISKYFDNLFNAKSSKINHLHRFYLSAQDAVNYRSTGFRCKLISGSIIFISSLAFGYVNIVSTPLDHYIESRLPQKAKAPEPEPAFLSSDKAMQQLFRIWGYETKASDAYCENTTRVQLVCKSGHLRLNDLITQGYPWIAEFKYQSTLFYGTVVRVNKDKMDILFDNKTWTITTHWYQTHATGKFTTFYKTTPLLAHKIDSNSPRTELQWLNLRLSRVLMLPPLATPVWRGELTERINAFQKQHNLLADGKVGESTLMTLSRYAENSPSLIIE